MKNWIVTLVIVALVSYACDAIAQTETNEPSKSTIAVALPHVSGLTSQPASIAKMMRLELIKLDKFKVFDEFDMNEIIKSNPEYSTECFGQNCLINLGKALNTDYVIFGSYDGLSNRIVVSLKMMDVKNKILYTSKVREFDDQEYELQRMVEIMLKDINKVEMSPEIINRLEFKNEPITSTNVGRINNSGPRVGVAYLMGSINEFAVRDESQGGLGIKPYVSMIGYQIEGQYVGTENFSALVEGILNVSGIEQGQFIPTLTLLNGFRFGKQGWEFAFGPGIGLKNVSSGFFDTDNHLGGGYVSESEWDKYAAREFADDPAYQIDNEFISPSVNEVYPNYNYAEHGDSRGDMKINTTFVFAIGKTFHAGALNIPVNAFYSSQKGGGMAGVSIGFNVQKSKSPINR